MVASAVQTMVDRIVERVHPIRVVLFGSHARGQATVHSDVDLLVVLSQVGDKRKVVEGINFPFRHDLDTLRSLLPHDWRVKSEHPDLAELTEWAVEARYPGDWPEAAVDDAKRAVVQARAVVESVRANLTLRYPAQ